MIAINRRLCVWILSLSLILTSCAGRKGREEAYSSSFFAMDTYMTFTVYDEDAKKAQSALRQAKEEIGRLEALWSVTDEDSDIYAVNHGGGRPVTVQEETAQIIQFALEMAEKTDGALEPTLYPVLTAWGFTKEENKIPSLEQIDRLLERVGYERVLVAVNADSEPYWAHFDAGCGRAVDLLTGQEHDFGGGSELPPCSAFFWRCER